MRSGSGNYQAWYLNGGEPRQIRPDSTKPIDILGDGFVVAPPSMGAKGRRYEIIRGTLDDLDRLPKMRVARSGKVQLPDGVPPNLKTGGRNNRLWRYCMQRAHTCKTIEELMEIAVAFNQTEIPPMTLLSDAEVLKVVASAWSYQIEGKNLFGRGGHITLDFDVVDDLAAESPNAFSLFGIVHRNHVGSHQDFIIANAMAKTLGWTLRAFKGALAELVERGLLECVHPGGLGKNDPPRYRFPR